DQDPVGLEIALHALLRVVQEACERFLKPPGPDSSKGGWMAGSGARSVRIERGKPGPERLDRRRQVLAGELDLAELSPARRFLLSGALRTEPFRRLLEGGARLLESGHGGESPPLEVVASSCFQAVGADVGQPAFGPAERLLGAVQQERQAAAFLVDVGELASRGPPGEQRLGLVEVLTRLLQPGRLGL